MSNHISEGTTKSYQWAFRKFSDFCKDQNIDPCSCSPAYIVKFIRLNYEKGASYSTINLLRSAISKYHGGFGAKSVGENPLVSQAVRAVFKLRPPMPKYKATFDINPVLDYISSLEPLEGLNLKMLTFKAFFLLTFASISRVSSISRLLAEVEETKVGLKILS